jgi:hypothetical protein
LAKRFIEYRKPVVPTLKIMPLDPSATIVFKGNIQNRIHHILSYSALRVIELSAGKVSVVKKGDRANITRVLATVFWRHC